MVLGEDVRQETIHHLDRELAANLYHQVDIDFYAVHSNSL